MTIFNTPIVTPILRLICLPIAWAIGWTCPRPIPRDLKQCVIIAAPHTSNWDFALFLVLMFVYRMQMNVLIKHTVFIGPVGWFLRYCGGIPIDRRRAAARVADMVRLFKTHKRINLLITPEGTRSPRTHWKTGFFHIALAAKVPVVVAYLDAEKKEAAVAWQFHPEKGKLDEEMKKIYALYDGCVGINPHNYASPNRPLKKPKKTD